MAEKEFYLARWETVEGEVQAKRFRASSYPRVEVHGERISPDDAPTLFDVYADEEKVATVLGERFISITKEDP